VPAPRKYPDEWREPALRLMAEAMTEDPQPSLNAAVHRIGQRVELVPDTLRGRAKQPHNDAGKAAGTTSADAARIKQPERENRELRRANEILLAASPFFARKLDPRLPR
jgi:transposase